MTPRTKLLYEVRSIDDDQVGFEIRRPSDPKNSSCDLYVRNYYPNSDKYSTPLYTENKQAYQECILALIGSKTQ